MRKTKLWRVRDGVTARYLSPETRNGEPIWVEYNDAELFSRKDAEAVAKAFGVIAERSA